MLDTSRNQAEASRDESSRNRGPHGPLSSLERHRRDVRSRDATARHGAAANEVSRATARSVTKERNIAERDIIVATLLSACRRADTHGTTYTGGNDIANLAPRFVETRRGDSPSCFLPRKIHHRRLSYVVRGGLSLLPLHVLYPPSTRTSERFSRRPRRPLIPAPREHR